MLPGLAYAQTHPAVHPALEWLAYFVGARLYWRARRRDPLPLARSGQFLLLAAGIAGAALGAIGLHLLDHAPALATATPAALAGKSVLGALLGGTLGSELAKRVLGYHRPTGDAWVDALAAGLVIGRLGCQSAGTWDQTYGAPLTVGLQSLAPWLGWDYGDGIARYPTGLIEIALVGLAWAWARRRAGRARPGVAFDRFVLAYCVARVLIEFLKPPFGAAAPGLPPTPLVAGLTAIQWAALAGSAWMTHRLLRRTGD